MKFLIAFLISVAMLNSSDFIIDKSHTQVTFKAKHMVIAVVKGEFHEYDGKIDFDAKNMVFNSLNVSIQTKSLDTGNEKRDEHLRSDDFFASKKYPKLIFKMTSYKGDKNSGKMEGDLTIKDITKKIILDTEISGTIKNAVGNEKVGFTLTGKIQKKDFGLSWNKILEAGGVEVSKTISIIVEVVAIEN